MRFLHVADVHLDTSFAGRSEEVRHRLRDASREAFRRAVEVALAEEVHAFLVAGDLFDGDRLSFRTERFLLDGLRRLVTAGVAVVYATGNHDPGRPGEGARPLPWPPGVHVADGPEPRQVVVRNRVGTPVGRVTAAGHATTRVTEDLSRRFPRPAGDLPEVALLHTQVHDSPGSADHHPYAPSELARLAAAGYHYWALGHVHARRVLSRDPPVVYAGSLQGIGWGEPGAHGATLVDLSDRSAPRHELRPVAPVRWETLRVGGLEEAGSLDGVLRRVEEAWRDARGGERTTAGGTTAEWMVRVELEGPTPLWRELGTPEDRETLGRELAATLDALEVRVGADRVHPPVPLDERRRREDVLGLALRLLEEVRGGGADLPGVAPGELAGAPEPDAAARWIRRVLEDGDGELAARFLTGEEP
jgi:DNA repair exonuclease SbcCD nuclease subunit